MTSWASVFWGRGADWVRFRGRCLANLGRLVVDWRSFMASGDKGWADTRLWAVTITKERKQQTIWVESVVKMYLEARIV